MLDYRFAVDKHCCHMAATFGVLVLMSIIAKFLRYTDNLNFIKDHISYVLLLILAP